jgi:hypothetical protein
MAFVVINLYFNKRWAQDTSGFERAGGRHIQVVRSGGNHHGHMKIMQTKIVQQLLQSPVEEEGEDGDADGLSSSPKYGSYFSY